MGACVAQIQPQSVLIYTEDGLAKLKKSYKSKTDEFIDRFSARAMRDKDGSRYDRLGDLMTQIFGNKLSEAKNLTAWPQAVVKNPVGSFHRWCFNFDKTTNPTKRVVMVDHGEYSYTGLKLVSDACLRRENVKQAKSAGERLLHRLVRDCTWRGPLIVPGAAQAPWCISGKLAAWLLDELEKRNDGKTISEHAEEQLQVIVERIAFKRDTYDKGNWKEDKVWSLLKGILKNVVNNASLVKMGNELVIMDRRDVEAMQGDDDGDTVVVETDPDTVQRFVDAEIFWKEFYKANGLRPLQIEMNKDNQIDFALANSVYSGTTYDQLSDKAKTLIDVFGVECPKIAKHFDLPGDKIPSPLGLNFALIHEINEKTRGVYGRTSLGLALNLVALLLDLSEPLRMRVLTSSFAPSKRPTRTWCSPSMVSVSGRVMLLQVLACRSQSIGLSGFMRLSIARCTIFVMLMAISSSTLRRS